MPRETTYIHAAPAAVEQAVGRLGANIAVARLRRRLRQEDLASRAGITRKTLHAIERGNLGTGIGAYVAVLRALGLHHTMAELAHPDLDLEGKTLEAARRGERVRAPGKLNDDF
jgi:transcriptional regulator with XRE-family HTH domain